MKTAELHHLDLYPAGGGDGSAEEFDSNSSAWERVKRRAAVVKAVDDQELSGYIQVKDFYSALSRIYDLSQISSKDDNRPVTLRAARLLLQAAYDANTIHHDSILACRLLGELNSHWLRGKLGEKDLQLSLRSVFIILGKVKEHSVEAEKQELGTLYDEVVSRGKVHNTAIDDINTGSQEIKKAEEEAAAEKATKQAEEAKASAVQPKEPKKPSFKDSIFKRFV